MGMKHFATTEGLACASRLGGVVRVRSGPACGSAESPDQKRELDAGRGEMGVQHQIKLSQQQAGLVCAGEKFRMEEMAETFTIMPLSRRLEGNLNFFCFLPSSRRVHSKARLGKKSVHFVWKPFFENLPCTESGAPAHFVLNYVIQ